MKLTLIFHFDWYTWNFFSNCHSGWSFKVKKREILFYQLRPEEIESKGMDYVKNGSAVNIDIKYDWTWAVLFPWALQIHEAALISQDSIDGKVSQVAGVLFLWWGIRQGGPESRFCEFLREWLEQYLSHQDSSWAAQPMGEGRKGGVCGQSWRPEHSTGTEGQRGTLGCSPALPAPGQHTFFGFSFFYFLFF